MSTKADRRTTKRTGVASFPVGTWVLPEFELSVSRAPWSHGGVSQVMARYDEKDAQLRVDADDVNLSVKATLRAKFEWVPDGNLAVFLHAQVTATGAPVTVECQVAYRMLVNRPSGVEDQQVFEFARTIGVRALFPYVRSAIATLSAQGALGAINLQPAVIEIAPKQPASSV